MNVQRIYKEFDREAKRILRAYGKTACEKLQCNACCGFAVELLEAEVPVIRQAIAAMSGTMKAEVQRRYTAWAVELERRGLTEWVTESERDRRNFEDRYADRLGLKCPLLNSAGRCSIYADRPLACRSFVALGSHECRPHETSPRPTALILLRQVAYDQMYGGRSSCKTYNLGQVVGEALGRGRAERAEEAAQPVDLETARKAIEVIIGELGRSIHRDGGGGSRAA